ncbi:MAG TPA: HWE histidine kinase domain-containing protein [Xanthobacteraceae bacterium]|nr:HWE histidine kinase domain-containing protein [Xanthobacteraceae bacterium]
MTAQRADSTTKQLREANDRLRREIAAHEETLRQLDAVRQELERRVLERTRELSLVKARFETALRGAKIYVFTQDRSLRYTWAYTPEGEKAGAQLVGRTDEDILPAAERESVIQLKKSVLDTGVPAACEVSYLLPEGRTLLALHVEPSFSPEGTIDGLICAAIDVAQIRSLESEQRRLTEELGTALQRYETALRGSRVTVFTQDKDLRYTSISNNFLRRTPEEIVGRSDSELLPHANRDAIHALKAAVLTGSTSQDSEVHVKGDGLDAWFDLHIEPLRNVAGDIVGLIGAAVDITQRKESEAHLRMLMREITHRSKNLLAVIQAMARQTARHAGSVESFLEQFGARLQALATSHDLLVMESWHGAPLHDLVRLQLKPFLDQYASRISFEGPAVLLKPEAAQSLGLALYELASNAVKYGALSTDEGRVTIRWRRLPAEEGSGLDLVWQESSESAVRPPSRRGFGTVVIERHLAKSIDAEVELAFLPEGVRCRVQVPLVQFVAPR